MRRIDINKKKEASINTGSLGKGLACVVTLGGVFLNPTSPISVVLKKA